jgi:hypothetical protein
MPEVLGDDPASGRLEVPGLSVDFSIMRMIDLSQIPDADLYRELEQRPTARAWAAKFSRGGGGRPQVPCRYCGRLVGKTPDRRKHETQCKKEKK